MRSVLSFLAALGLGLPVAVADEPLTVSLEPVVARTATVAIDDGRLVVRFEGLDSETNLRGVRVELEVGEKVEETVPLEPTDGAFEFGAPLPDGVRDTKDLVGTLHAVVDDRPLRGSIGTSVVVAPSRPRVSPWRVVGLLVVYSALIVAASLFGGWLPTRFELTHDRMQLAMSLVGGLMLGIALFHLLPHGVRELSSLDRGVWWTMVGLVVMFLLIRTFHFHQHGPVAQPMDHVHGPPLCDHDHDDSHSHAGPHDSRDHGHGHGHDHGPHEWTWVGVFAGLSLHTLIDGVALAASVQADARHGGSGWLLGVGTFLAILLHKPLDAVSITTLMSASGSPRSARNLANLAYASMCPLGAIAFVFGIGQLGGAQHVVIGAALCFAAGVFLCISLGDILPEMEFHDHNRIVLTLTLFTGIALAWAIGFLEPGAHPS